MEVNGSVPARPGSTALSIDQQPFDPPVLGQDLDAVNGTAVHTYRLRGQDLALGLPAYPGHRLVQADSPGGRLRHIHGSAGKPERFGNHRRRRQEDDESARGQPVLVVQHDDIPNHPSIREKLPISDTLHDSRGFLLKRGLQKYFSNAAPLSRQLGARHARGRRLIHTDLTWIIRT